MNVFSPLGARRMKTDLRPSDAFIVRKTDPKPIMCVNSIGDCSIQQVAQLFFSVFPVWSVEPLAANGLIVFLLSFSFMQLSTSSSINATSESISSTAYQSKWYRESTINRKFEFNP